MVAPQVAACGVARSCIASPDPGPQLESNLFSLGKFILQRRCVRGADHAGLRKTRRLLPRARVTTPAERARPATTSLLYDSRDLTTHAVCVGMTGSGKTGLCLSLLEEAGIDGVPAICIDPKGDLGNLLLTFPHLAPRISQPWVDAGEARAQGPERRRATRRRRPRPGRRASPSGARTPERIGRLRDAADVAIYTPGAETRAAAVGAALVRAAAARAARRRRRRCATASARSSRACSACSASRPIRSSSREHILLSTSLEGAWRAGTAPRHGRPDPGACRSRRSTSSARSTSRRSSRRKTGSSSRWRSTTSSPRRASRPG